MFILKNVRTTSVMDLRRVRKRSLKLREMQEAEAQAAKRRSDDVDARRQPG